MDQNKSSGRLYAAIFYPCMLAAVMLVGVMLFSPNGGVAASAAIASGGAVSNAAIQTSAALTMPAATTVPAPAATELSLRWSGAQLYEFIHQPLEAADIGLHVNTIELRDPDQVCVQATANREQISQVIEESSLDNKSLILFALRLFPEEVSADVAFSINCTDGVLSLTPLELTIAGLELPVTLIPETVQTSFVQLASQTLAQQGCSLERLFIADNTLYLDCTLQLGASK